MSKSKISVLDQYGFEQQQCETAGVEGVKLAVNSCGWVVAGRIVQRKRKRDAVQRRLH